MTTIDRFETTQITATQRTDSMPNITTAAQTDRNAETFYRALGQLMSDSVRELLPVVEEDPVDSLRLGADVFSVAAFIAERTRAQQTGASEPQFPPLTSHLARNFAGALHDWIVEVNTHLAPEVRERLDLIEPLLEHSFKGRDGELLKFMKEMINSDARATAHAITGLVHIAKWKAL